MQRDQAGAVLGMALAVAATAHSQAASLKWRNSPGTWDVGITANWLSGFTPTTFNNGDTVTFDNNGANFATNVVTIATNVQPASATVSQPSVNYTFTGSGAITGACGLFKTGTGSLTLSTTNSYTGGTTITGGSVLLANSAGAGTGPITNNGAALTIAGFDLPNALNCTGSAVLTNATTTGGIYALSGSGTLAISSVGQVFDFRGDMTSFGGTLYLSNCTAGVRFWDTTGSSSATFDFGNGSVALSIRNNSAGPFALGALTGGSGTRLTGNGTYAQPASYTIGGNNASNTFSGTIANGTTGYPTAITKTGSGTLTLAGTNTYTGATTVSAGILALTGPAAITNSSAIAVASGAVLDVSGLPSGLLTLRSNQTLSGSGTIRGSLTVPVGSTLSPGDGIGTLTVTNALTLAGTTIMELNRTNAPATNDMLVAAAFTATGSLWVTNLGPALLTGDSFKLFSAPVSGFAAVSLPVSDGTTTYVWTNKLQYDGSIQVVSGASPIPSTPTNIVSSFDGVHLTLSWPANYTGWLLQTNSVGVTVTSSWFTLPGSASTNRIIVTPDPAKPGVFYRLAYPYP